MIDWQPNERQNDQRNSKLESFDASRWLKGFLGFVLVDWASFSLGPSFLAHSGKHAHRILVVSVIGLVCTKEIGLYRSGVESKN